MTIGAAGALALAGLVILLVGLRGRYLMSQGSPEIPGSLAPSWSTVPSCLDRVHFGRRRRDLDRRRRATDRRDPSILDELAKLWGRRDRTAGRPGVISTRSLTVRCGSIDASAPGQSAVVRGRLAAIARRLLDVLAPGACSFPSDSPPRPPSSSPGSQPASARTRRWYVEKAKPSAYR